MQSGTCGRFLALAAMTLGLFPGCSSVRDIHLTVHPEQRRIVYCDPESLPECRIPTFVPPRTVSNPENGQASLILSLDEAIEIALNHSEVVRVLTGLTATASGQTIYNPAIVNTTIDQARARFDPVLSADNTWTQDETALGAFDPLPPSVRIFGSRNELYILDANVAKTNPFGGTARMGVAATRSFLEPGVFPLNPQTSHFTELSYVQPLLRGGGLRPNIAPILIAGIDTERSFFQFKDSIQELVRGTVEAYWALVFARTDRWARQQQVDQSSFAYNRELARQQRGFGDLADVAQTRLALANFRSTLVAAESNVLQREAALLNVIGISPTDVGEVIPTTPPFTERLEFNWNELVSLAETFRPDLIELKLIIEADRQRLAIAENEALPSLDAVGLYRWDGLRGRTPGSQTLATSGDAFTDWTVGVNFSVPLGLREGRAGVRAQELVLVRDRADLQQGLHNAVHLLALNVRNLDQFYEQYEAITESRDAARDNLLQQASEFQRGRVIFLNVLQAITDWGNSVSAQAEVLSRYNTELVDLEQQTGTILEAHGIRFMEERFRFAGPISCCHDERCYPAGIYPTPNALRYPTGDKPAEESFDLTSPFTPGELDEPLQPMNPEPRRTPSEVPPAPLEAPSSETP